MIPWMEAFLVFTAVEKIWCRYLDSRQYSLLKKRQLPSELKNSISEDEFNKSVDYSIDKLKFSMIQETFGFIINVAFYVFYLLPYLWKLSTTLSIKYFGLSNEYIDALIFLGIQIPINKILGLPFELYYDFVIEERHGFNKKTFKLFFMDDIKKLLLTCIIGSPILCIVIWVVKWGGETFYIWLWGVSVAITFIMMTIYPNLIAPLFNKFDALEDEELKIKIEKLAASIEYPLKKIYQVDASKRSAHSNAYMYGFGKNKRIVLFDTLLDSHHDRILAVVGHELGHWKLSHTIKNIFVGFTHMFIMFYLFGFILYSNQIYESFGFNEHIINLHQKPIIIGLLLFFNIYEPVSLIIGIAMTCLSRVHEFQADRFSAELGMSKPLQEGLLDLQRKNLSSFTVDPLFAWFHYSHPHLIERLKALKAYDEQKEKKEE